MDATRFLDLHYEELYCPLAFMHYAIHSLIQGSLGHNRDTTLQVLPYIFPFTVQGFLGLIKGTHLQDLPCILAFIGQRSLGPLRQHKIWFYRNPQFGSGVTKRRLYCNPQFGSGITRPCVLPFRDPPHLFRIHPEIHLNQNMRTPSHHGYSEMERLG